MSRWAGRAASSMLISTAALNPRVALAQTTTDTAPTSASIPTPKNSPDVAPSQTPVLDTWGTTKSSEPPNNPNSETQPESDQGPKTDQTVAEVPGDSHDYRTETDSDSGARPHLRYTLERIEVRGNTRTRDRVILRYLKFQPGDILDVDDPELTLTRYRVLGTGFFRDVQFSLHKGSRRGQVVLVVQVVERNTIVINDFVLGLSSDADNNGHIRPLTEYGGVDVAETNLAGTGITLGAALAVAHDQNALRVRFLYPSFLGTPWMVSGTILRNQARDFFGTTSDVTWVDSTIISMHTRHTQSSTIRDLVAISGLAAI